MRNYKAIIDLDTQNRIINVANQIEAEVDVFEGSLLDNVIIANTQAIKIGQIKSRKYMIMLEKPVSVWNSSILLIMTDDEETYLKHYNELSQKVAVEAV